MCGRFVLFASPQEVNSLFGAENLPNFPPRYNAAPMQQLPIIVHNKIGFGRWGFIPPWLESDDKALAAKMINARSETVSEKPSFSKAWSKKQRCLVPANGFYEWKKEEGSKLKQPYYIHTKDDECFAFAGLWSKVGDIVSFTILTKTADSHIAELHARMPVIIRAKESSKWFKSSESEAFDMIENASATDFLYHAVDSKVGKVSNDSAELIDELKMHPSKA